MPMTLELPRHMQRPIAGHRARETPAARPRRIPPEWRRGTIPLARASAVTGRRRGDLLQHRVWPGDVDIEPLGFCRVRSMAHIDHRLDFGDLAPPGSDAGDAVHAFGAVDGAGSIGLAIEFFEREAGF